MAAKFISFQDPTGEVTLKHWIAQGQIQDSLIKSLAFNKVVIKTLKSGVPQFRVLDFKTLRSRTPWH